MTRKRLRYSDLAASAAQPGPEPEPELEVEHEAEIWPEPETELEVEHETDIWPEAVPVPELQSPAGASRPRRDSTPVELARTLSAVRAAAPTEEGAAPEGVTPRPAYLIAAHEKAPHRTMRERARARSGVAELLMFRVGGERFGVELILVDEVIDLPVIHHVPEMPPAMLGVVTVRGSLTPVYSPQQALGLPLALRDALLIFRRGGFRVGILIDDVDDATTVDMRELREAPGGDEVDSVLLGVVRLSDALVGIIDVDELIKSCQSANILEPA